jgi:hypothetical protein
VWEPLLQAFPFPSTLRKVTLHSRSRACVFIYSSCGRWVFPPFCGVFLPLPLSQAFLLLITEWCCCSCQPPYLFTVHMGSGSSLLSCGVFLPPPLSPAFLLLVSGCVPLLPPEPHLPTQLVYLQSRESSVLSVPHLLSCVSLLLFLLITQFLFFPQVEVRLSRVLCCSGPGLSGGVLWYHEAHLVCIFPSHLDAGDWRPGGPPCFSI